MDDNYFISGSIDGKVRIWDISGGQVVNWVHVGEIVTAICYRPDGKVFSHFLIVYEELMLKEIYMNNSWFLQGLVVGTLTGNCCFYDASGNINLLADLQILLFASFISLHE